MKQKIHIFIDRAARLTYFLFWRLGSLLVRYIMFLINSIVGCFVVRTLSTNLTFNYKNVSQ